MEVSLYVHTTRIIQYSLVTDIMKIIFLPIFVANVTLYFNILITRYFARPQSNVKG